MIKKFLFCLIFIVSGCSSAPKSETQYFVLASDTQAKSSATTNVVENELKSIIVLESIKLADYLSQPGIVLQTDAHQIEVAHYHRWGEPLKRSLHRYVLEILSTQLTQQSLLSSDEFSSDLVHQELEITVNQFNGTTDGKALLSGHWLLKQADTKTYIVHESFSYHATLASSGYPELVNQLAELLEQLCREIAQAINGLEPL
jgi:uncharacterized lipoprotein YmbA